MVDKKLQKKTTTTEEVKTPKKGALEIEVVEATEDAVEHLHITGEEVDIVVEENYIKITEYKGILKNLKEINKAIKERTDGRLQISEALTFIVDGVDQETFKWSLVW